MRTNHLASLALVFLVGGCGGGANREPTPPGVTELTAMLQSGNPGEQIKAASWVQQLGPKAAETAPALIAALKSEDLVVRQNAAAALGHLGPDAAQAAVPALTEALGDPEESVRRFAADALGNLGPAAASAIPALEELSRRPDVCNAAPNALKKIRP